MTEMGFSEVKFLETLQDVPPSWKSGYTPVKEKRGFVVGLINIFTYQSPLFRKERIIKHLDDMMRYT